MTAAVLSNESKEVADVLPRLRSGAQHVGILAVNHPSQAPTP